jgi:prepilin-type N-terminal cleavage/methylation domain-containing protein
MPKEKEGFLSNKSIKGFTLVELIIVIAIIGILVTAVLFTINPLKVLSDSRNTTRKQDVLNLTKAIQKGMIEGTLTLTSGDTDSSNSALTNFAIDGTGYVKFTKISNTPAAQANLNIARLPQDPLNNAVITCPDGYACSDIGNSEKNKYRVVFCSNGTDFEVNVRLENDYNLDMHKDGGDDEGAYEVGTNLTICKDKFPGFKKS